MHYWCNRSVFLVSFDVKSILSVVFRRKGMAEDQMSEQAASRGSTSGSTVPLNFK